MRHVIVFTKEPIAGCVKTRLGETIGSDAAAGVASAFVEDCVRLAAAAAEQAGAELHVAHAPDLLSDGFVMRLRSYAPAVRLVPQGEGPLGARLARVLTGLDGARVAIGSDAPDLPRESLLAGFRALETGAAVVGPARDGGYYLIGLAAETRAAVLADPAIAWSAASTCADTLAALRADGCEATLLEEHLDVDDADDLRALAARLADSPDSVAPATRAWLATRHQA